MEEVPAKLRSRPMASTIASRPARKPKPQKPTATVPSKGKAGRAETGEGASAFREASRRALDWHSYRGVGFRCPEALGGEGKRRNPIAGRGTTKDNISTRQKIKLLAECATCACHP